MFQFFLGEQKGIANSWLHSWTFPGNILIINWFLHTCGNTVSQLKLIFKVMHILLHYYVKLRPKFLSDISCFSKSPRCEGVAELHGMAFYFCWLQLPPSQITQWIKCIYYQSRPDTENLQTLLRKVENLMLSVTESAPAAPEPAGQPLSWSKWECWAR